jgi:hypothetical protein
LQPLFLKYPWKGQYPPAIPDINTSYNKLQDEREIIQTIRLGQAGTYCFLQLSG